MPFTVDGLEIRTVEEILAEIEAEQSAAFGVEVQSGAFSVFGQLNAIVATEIRRVEEALALVVASFDPRSASGDGLERVSSYTGTFRRAATPSTVELSVTCDDGTNLAPGALVVATSGTEARRFVNVDPVVNTSGGSAVIVATAQSEESGPVEAAAGTLTVLAEPAPGVTDVTNLAAADLGRDADSDAELRVRRQSELARAGVSTVDAIRADVLDALAPDVEDVVVFENQTDVTDGDGLPPHSVEVLVYDGTVGGTLISDAAAAQAVFDARPAGIATFGTTTEDAFDSRGVARSTDYSRPTIVAIEVEITITRGPDWTTAVDDAIEEALAAFVDAQVGIGQDLVLSHLYGPVLGGGEDGDGDECEGAARVPEEVEDVTLIRARIPPAAFAAANVVADPRDLLTLIAADVTVLETP